MGSEVGSNPSNIFKQSCEVVSIRQGCSWLPTIKQIGTSHFREPSVFHIFPALQLHTSCLFFALMRMLSLSSSQVSQYFPPMSLGVLAIISCSRYCFEVSISALACLTYRWNMLFRNKLKDPQVVKGVLSSSKTLSKLYIGSVGAVQLRVPPLSVQRLSIPQMLLIATSFVLISWRYVCTYTWFIVLSLRKSSSPPAFLSV